MTDTTLAVIVPVYNRARIVVRTLESIALQSYRHFHLVLVDNNSTDDTWSVLNEFKSKHESDDMPVTVVKECKRGAAAARNAGLAASESEWVMFFDSDDVMDYRLIDRYMTVVRQWNNDVDIVVTKAEVEYGDGSRWLYPYYEKNLLTNHIFHAILSTLRYIAKRSIVEKAGKWNETLPNSCWDDWELGARILLQHPKAAFLSSEVLVRVYHTAESITGQNFASKQGCWEHAIDTVEKIISESSEPSKNRLIKYLEFKRVALAGDYKREGHNELSSTLWRQVYSRVRHDVVMSWLYPLAYLYIGMGGRGVSHIVKHLVR